MMKSPSSLVTDDLPPPYIKENPAFTLLNPVPVRHTLTVVLNDEMQPTDRFSVKWQGAPGTPAEGSYTSDFVLVGNARPVELRIPNSLVTYNLGQTITLTYTVISGDLEPQTSQPLILYVLPLAQGDLPRPFIPQADNGGEGLKLDVNNLTEFTLRINGWPLIAYNQTFWLRLRGTNANGSAFEVMYWPGIVVDESFILRGFHAQNHDAAPLKGLRNLSILTLELMATLGRSQDEAVAMRFAPRHYIVRTDSTITPEAPLIKSVKNPLGQDIADGQDTVHTTVTIDGTAMEGEEVEVFDRQTPIGTVRADAGRWEYRVAALTEGSHEFKAQALYGNGDVSNRWTINVLRDDRQLRIKEALDNIDLDPLAVTRSLTAIVNYDIRVNDRIRVTWTAAQGTPAAGSQTTNTFVAVSTGPIEIALRVPLVAFSLGKTVEITYTYERGVSPPVTSQPFPINVRPLPAAVFIAPVITQANGTNVLILQDVMAGATLLFGGWPHIATGQRVWLDLEGENGSGTSHNLTPWIGTNNTVYRSWATSNSYSLTIAYSYLQHLRDGSTLSIRFRINMDQVPDPARVVVFDVREYIVRATP